MDVTKACCGVALINTIILTRLVNLSPVRVYPVDYTEHSWRPQGRLAWNQKESKTACRLCTGCTETACSLCTGLVHWYCLAGKQGIERCMFRATDVHWYTSVTKNQVRTHTPQVMIPAPPGVSVVKSGCARSFFCEAHNEAHNVCGLHWVRAFRA